MTCCLCLQPAFSAPGVDPACYVQHSNGLPPTRYRFWQKVGQCKGEDPMPCSPPLMLLDQSLFLGIFKKHPILLSHDHFEESHHFSIMRDRLFVPSFSQCMNPAGVMMAVARACSSEHGTATGMASALSLPVLYEILPSQEQRSLHTVIMIAGQCLQRVHWLKFSRRRKLLC